ncbi:MAG TPA: hypothetical protein VFB38_19130 [Chthonomonadaceae bacterium]|nr:hypothetical protein [Chthonomonadaceae bacterium]
MRYAWGRADNKPVASAALLQGATALALKEIERPILLKECARVAPEEQSLFLMIYGCFVLWAITRALEAALPPDTVRAVVRTIRDAFATCPWFDNAVFAPIWEQMLIVMPTELSADSYSGLVYPAADMLMAASLAGHALGHEHSPEFAEHVSATIGGLARKVQALIAELPAGPS